MNAGRRRRDRRGRRVPAWACSSPRARFAPCPAGGGAAAPSRAATWRSDRRLGDRSDEIGSLGRSFDAMAEQPRGERAGAATHVPGRRPRAQDAPRRDRGHHDGGPGRRVRPRGPASRDGARPVAGSCPGSRRPPDREPVAEAGALPLDRRAVAVGPLLASVVRDMAARASGAGHRDRAAGADTPEVDAQRDPIASDRWSVALVDNASATTPAGGRITSWPPRSATAIAIRVADTGPGIAEADLPHVFESLLPGDPLATARRRDIRSRPGDRAGSRGWHTAGTSVANEPGAGPASRCPSRRLTLGDRTSAADRSPRSRLPAVAKASPVPVTHGSGAIDITGVQIWTTGREPGSWPIGNRQACRQAAPVARRPAKEARS